MIVEVRLYRRTSSSCIQLFACGRASEECVEKECAFFMHRGWSSAAGGSALQFTGIAGEASRRKKNLCGFGSLVGDFFFCVWRTKYADVELGREREGRQSP